MQSSSGQGGSRTELRCNSRRPYSPTNRTLPRNRWRYPVGPLAPTFPCLPLADSYPSGRFDVPAFAHLRVALDPFGRHLLRGSECSRLTAVPLLNCSDRRLPTSDFFSRLPCGLVPLRSMVPEGLGRVSCVPSDVSCISEPFRLPCSVCLLLVTTYPAVPHTVKPFLLPDGD